MNPIEKDLKNYYGTSSDSDILEHYGTKCHSGRYPWGSKVYHWFGKSGRYLSGCRS